MKKIGTHHDIIYSNIFEVGDEVLVSKWLNRKPTENLVIKDAKGVIVDIKKDRYIVELDKLSLLIDIDKSPNANYESISSYKIWVREERLKKLLDNNRKK